MDVYRVQWQMHCYQVDIWHLIVAWRCLYRNIYKPPDTGKILCLLSWVQSSHQLSHQAKVQMNRQPQIQIIYPLCGIITKCVLFTELMHFIPDLCRNCCSLSTVPFFFISIMIFVIIIIITVYIITEDLITFIIFLITGYSSKFCQLSQIIYLPVCCDIVTGSLICSVLPCIIIEFPH